MNGKQPKLSLDQPVIYEIFMPGKVNADWLNLVYDIDVFISTNEAGVVTSKLRGLFDQAALQGLLRRLYSLGIPLQSVRWIKKNQAAKPVD
jgi:hypothetical protein